MEDQPIIKKKGGKPKKYFTEEERKNAIRQQQREFRIRNPDKIIENRNKFKNKTGDYNTKYYQTHRDKILNNIYTCTCGKTINKAYLRVHIHTKVHNDRMNKLNQTNDIPKNIDVQ